MDPVEGEPGMFTFTFVPEDFFLGTPSNIDQTPHRGAPGNGVRWYITKPGYTSWARRRPTASASSSASEVRPYLTEKNA